MIHRNSGLPARCASSRAAITLVRHGTVKNFSSAGVGTTLAIRRSSVAPGASAAARSAAACDPVQSPGSGVPGGRAGAGVDVTTVVDWVSRPVAASG